MTVEQVWLLHLSEEQTKVVRFHSQSLVNCQKHEMLRNFMEFTISQEYENIPEITEIELCEACDMVLNYDVLDEGLTEHGQPIVLYVIQQQFKRGEQVFYPDQINKEVKQILTDRIIEKLAKSHLVDVTFDDGKIHLNVTEEGKDYL